MFSCSINISLYLYFDITYLSRVKKIIDKYKCTQYWIIQRCGEIRWHNMVGGTHKQRSYDLLGNISSIACVQRGCRSKYIYFIPIYTLSSKAVPGEDSMAMHSHAIPPRLLDPQDLFRVFLPKTRNLIDFGDYTDVARFRDVLLT